MLFKCYLGECVPSKVNDHIDAANDFDEKIGTCRQVSIWVNLSVAKCHSQMFPWRLNQTKMQCASGHDHIIGHGLMVKPFDGRTKQ